MNPARDGQGCGHDTIFVFMCSSIASRVRWNIGRARRFVDAPKRAIQMPKIVVFGDDLSGRHHADKDVGDIAP